MKRNKTILQKRLVILFMIFFFISLNENISGTVFKANGTFDSSEV